MVHIIHIKLTAELIIRTACKEYMESSSTSSVVQYLHKVSWADIFLYRSVSIAIANIPAASLPER